MTETFDFAEAVARMKAGKIVERYYAGRAAFKFKMEDGTTLVWMSLDEDRFTECDETYNQLNAWKYSEYTPTVSGKQAIAAFIDDPSLIVRCVDWSEQECLTIHNECLHRANASLDMEVRFKDLQQGRWTVEKNDD